jgi:DNA polymerase-3 subunit beta
MAGRRTRLRSQVRARGSPRRERLTLAVTDCYRLAVWELAWSPHDASAAAIQVLLPARTIADAANSLTHGWIP